VTLTAKDVAEIMRLLEQSGFDSLSLEIDGVKLNVQRGLAAPVRQPAPAVPVTQPAVESQPQPVQSSTRKAKPPSEPGLAEVASPLLGIFYRAPKPGEPPFVEVGSKVNEETVIGIIEVMKLMNSVHAGVKGEVVEILAANGGLVEYSEVLLRVRPEA
jgi:acetyl-CoA carboxylase biotin carboxyl carrier protein